MIKDRAIAASLIIASLGAILFVVAYATGGDRLFEGLALALCGAGFCATAAGWVFWILPHQEVVEQREDYTVASPARAAMDAQLHETAVSVTRKKMLTRMLYAALGFFGIALVVPVASLGPAIGDAPFHTKWRKGTRMQRADGRLVKVSDLNVDSFATVFPEGAIGDEQSQTMLIRVPDGIARSANGYVAYSKVCTHAGCPVALYRADAKQLMCPCHQSVFDAVDNGHVVSGPADHALPRLPLQIDDDGYVIAMGDFPTPVGPGFWNEDV